MQRIQQRLDLSLEEAKVDIAMDSDFDTDPLFSEGGPQFTKTMLPSTEYSDSVFLCPKIVQGISDMARGPVPNH